VKRLAVAPGYLASVKGNRVVLGARMPARARRARWHVGELAAEAPGRGAAHLAPDDLVRVERVPAEAAGRRRGAAAGHRVAADVAHLAGAAGPHCRLLREGRLRRLGLGVGRAELEARRLRPPRWLPGAGRGARRGALVGQVVQKELLRAHNGLKPALRLLAIIARVLVRVEDQGESPEGALHVLGAAPRRQPQHEAGGDLPAQLRLLHHGARSAKAARSHARPAPRLLQRDARASKTRCRSPVRDPWA